MTSPQQPLAAKALSSASSVEPATTSSPATEAAVAPPAQAEPVPDSLIDEVLMQEFEQALVDQKKNPPSKSGPSAAPARGLDQEPVDLDKMLTEAQMMQSSASSSDSSEASSGGAEAIPSLEALPTDAGKIEQEAASLNSGPSDQQVMEQFENFIQGGEKKSS